MQEQSVAAASHHYSRSFRRYWRATNKPGSWWPWGLAPLLGLALLFLIGAFLTAPGIESQTEKHVAAALAAIDVDAEVRANGQSIEVIAHAPASAEAQIRAVAKSTACETWAGALICPTSVTVSLLASETMPAAEPIATPARWHNFEFERHNGGVTLRGETPDEASRRAAIATARSYFDTVNDALIVSGTRATEGHDAAATRALQVLNNIDQGYARWTDGELSAVGRVHEAEASSARDIFRAGNPTLPLGELELQVIEDVKRCNQEFSATLAGTAIRFDTASAVINKRSNNLISKLAAIARACPGRLVIEGHTDDVGSESGNHRLSLQRAEAVRGAFTKLGLAQNGLVAVGFGEARPVADNTTVEGRARNRRIVIRVADFEQQ